MGAMRGRGCWRSRDPRMCEHKRQMTLLLFVRRSANFTARVGILRVFIEETLPDRAAARLGCLGDLQAPA